MIKPYFPHSDDLIAPLKITVKRRVRFEEVDALGIVWHGRYPGYFEDARAALGATYDVGYLDFYKNGVFAPIKKLHIDYHRPLKFDESFSIKGILHWSEAARMNYEFIIRDAHGKMATSGYSVQMMLDGSGEILVLPPPFYLEFCKKWKRGELA